MLKGRATNPVAARPFSIYSSEGQKKLGAVANLSATAPFYYPCMYSMKRTAMVTISLRLAES